MQSQVSLLQRYNPRGGSLYQLWMGIRFFWSGWSLFWQSGRLKLISLVPILLTVGIFTGLGYLSIQLTEMLLQGIPAGWPGWLVGIIDTLGTILTLIISILLSYLLFFPIASVISGPFREALATQTEILILGQASEASAGSVLTIIGDVIQSVLFQLSVLILTLSLGWFTPAVGPFITIVLLMYLASLDMVDPALSIRGYLLGQKLKFLRSHLALMAGFGIMAFVLLGIPVLNLLILPVASIGGTILVVGVMQPQALHSAQSQVDQSSISDGKAS